MDNIHAFGLVELTKRDQQKITGGREIGFLNILASVITAESESTESKSFSIHWDDSGLSFQPQ